MLTIIRSPLFKFIGIILFVFINYAVIYTAGERNIQTKWDYEKANTKAVVEVLKSKSQVIQTKIVTEYVDRVKTITIKGKTIEKIIPQVITTQDDSACTINTGTIRLLNAAAENNEFDYRPETDGTPSEVELSTVTTSVADNYIICNKNYEQLEALIDAIQSNEKLTD